MTNLVMELTDALGWLIGRGEADAVEKMRYIIKYVREGKVIHDIWNEMQQAMLRYDDDDVEYIKRAYMSDVVDFIDMMTEVVVQQQLKRHCITSHALMDDSILEQWQQVYNHPEYTDEIADYILEQDSIEDQYRAISVAYVALVAA